METRNIAVKNYVIYAVIAILTVLVVYFLGEWYKGYSRNEAVISTVLYEIKENELVNYLIENPTAIIYIKNESEISKNYENILKELVLEYNLRDEIVYLKETELSKSDILKGAIITAPNLIFIENGNIKKVLKTKEEDLTKEKTIEFLEKIEVIEK